MGPFDDDFTIDTQMLMVFGAARVLASVAPIINYAASFTPVAAQTVFAGQAPSAAFPAGVEALTNYQSSAGAITVAERQVSVNGGAWTTTLTGNLDPGQTVAIRVRVVDSAANERFFPAAGGSVTTAQALPVSTVATAPAITTTGRIGASQSRTAATWSAIPGTPAGMAREVEGRWMVGGSQVSTAATYTPLETENLANLVREERARHTLNTKVSAWSAWSASAPVQITYNAPTAGSLSNVTYTQGTGNQTVNAATAFSVVGDADLSGVTWTLTAAPAGVTISASGVVTIPTGALLSGQTVTVRATNSGGFAQASFTVTVQAAPTAAVLTQTGFDDATETWTISTTLGEGNYRIATSLTSNDPTYTIGTGWSGTALETFTVAVNASGTVNLDLPTFTAATGNTGDTRRLTIVQDNGALSNYLRVNFTVDRTAPVISGTSVTAGNAQLTYAWSVGEVGTRWHVVTTSATVPSVAQIKAGQNHLGAAAVASGTGAVTATGAQTAIVASSLTNGTQYWFHVIVEDAHRNVSAVSTVTGTPVAGASFSAAYVPSSYVNNNTLFDPTHLFSNVPIGAADSTRRLYIWFFTFGGEANTITLSVNGGAGISATEQIRPQGFRQVLLFVADVPTGTTANFLFSTSGTDFQQASMAVVRAVGTHTSATATASPNGTSLDVAINTVAGDTLFVGIMGRQGVANGSFYTPPSGFTEHVDAALKPTDTPNPSAPLFLGSGAATGGTPQTITTTAADFTESAILALRLRAA